MALFFLFFLMNTHAHTHTNPTTPLEGAISFVSSLFVAFCRFHWLLFVTIAEKTPYTFPQAMCLKSHKTCCNCTVVDDDDDDEDFFVVVGF